MSNAPNPYAGGPRKPIQSPPTVMPIDHSRAFNYIFENPNGVTNVLFVALCTFIPIVGPIVMNGYQFEVVEHLHRNRGRWYPDFDFNRFGEYLTRGLWVFLVSLIVSVVLVPVVWILMAGGMALFGVVAAGMGDLAIIVFPIGIVVFMGISILIGMSMIPLTLKAGLQQDFNAGFDMNFAVEFLTKNFWQLILSAIIMCFVSLVMMVLGLAAVCIGVYFAAAVLNMMASHLLWQFYERHLALGGQPIPLKDTTPPSHPQQPKSF